MKTTHRSWVRFAAAGLLAAAVSSPAAAKWPTWRADSARSGFTAENLPAKLSFRWRYQARHAPRPAWSGRDTRMPFDRASRVAAAGGKLFFGSSADGKVYALDVTTGAESWSYFTEAPVRLGPTVWKGRVFVPGDDGFLYCFAAADGSLIWKFRGGPDDSMVLGNDHMISRWPVRGGPVISDRVVYFAAGIWPSEGIYLYALDAGTSKVLWCNDSSGSIEMPQPHPTAVARSGVSAQGDLAVSGNHLLVPTGRAVPAAFRREDGKLLYFHLQRYGHHQGGGSTIVSLGSLFSSGGAFFDTKTGNLIHRGAAGSLAAVTPDRVFVATAKEILAFDRARILTRKETVDRLGKKTTRIVLSPPIRRLPSPHHATALIAAGNRIVLGGKGKVSVLDAATGKVVFSAEVDGTAFDLAAADGRLFASTDTGEIVCFGAAGEAKPPPPPVPAARSSAPPDSFFASAAREILRRSKLREGYCVDLGCGDGSLAYALARGTNLQILAVDPDPKNVRQARERLDGAGLLGTRVTVHAGDPAQTPYPDYFADLVVSSRSVVQGRQAAPAAEMYRLQRPYGGVTCMGRPGAMQMTVRAKLEGAGEWTHQYADPANTDCSDDALLHGPLEVQWFTDWGFTMPSRHGRGPAPLFHQGRMFVEGLDGVLCVNAYNGRKLWEYPLPGILRAYDQEHLMGTSGTGSNMCVGETGLYVRTATGCLRIDAASGKLLGKLKAPLTAESKPGIWGLVVCSGPTLYGTLADTHHVVKWRYLRGDMRTQFTESRLLFALDARSGAEKWRYAPEHSIRNNTVAIGAGRVFLIDRAQAVEDRLEQQADAARRRGKAPEKTAEKAPEKPPPQPGGILVALDAQTGAVAWKSDDDIFGTLLALSEPYDVILMAYQDTRFKLGSEVGGRMAALRASDGKRLWDIQARYASRPLINDRTVYAQPGAWSLLTGRPETFRFERSYGCGILAASRRLMVFRSATLGYIDLEGGGGTRNYGGIRPGCWINAVPAGGLVLMPDATDRCTCSYLIKSSIALRPRKGDRP